MPTITGVTHYYVERERERERERGGGVGFKTGFLCVTLTVLELAL
jgi:hypothetical protein